MLNTIMRHPNYDDNDILELAIQAVHREAGLRLQPAQGGPGIQDRQYDAEITLNNTTLLAAIKKWAQHVNLGALIHQIRNLPGKGLLVADYVNPKMAEELRQANVQFIDTAGNAYINQPPTYIYIRGNRPEAPTGQQPGEHTRAFEPAGLKTIFALLSNPALVAEPYRKIVDVAGVAVGTVGRVLNDLKGLGYIKDQGDQRKRRLTDYRRLLERWTEMYPQRLRPKLLIGAFQATDPQWWQEVNIRDFNGFWGGEIAAARYTNILRPAVATIYFADHNWKQLIVTHRLRKVEKTTFDATGLLYAYKVFWNAKATGELVDPVLAYADLIATGDARNLEAARELLETHIAARTGTD